MGFGGVIVLPRCREYRGYSISIMLLQAALGCHRVSVFKGYKHIKQLSVVLFTGSIEFYLG